MSGQIGYSAISQNIGYTLIDPWKCENPDDTKDPQMCVHNGLQDR